LVACVTGSAGPTGSNAVLLGPAIVGRTQIDKAIAVPPDAQQGMTEWAVAITLSDGGTAWWARYTTAHHTGGDSNVAGVDQCGATGTPCADYVGVTVDGRLISVPVNIEAITGGTTQIAGNFTEVSAKALAASIQSGPLPVPLRAATMQSLP
jgi:preprotein translocase subunit SecD